MFSEFQQQNLFENQEINRICDQIFDKIISVYHKTTDMVICGSVAKMLSGLFAENYTPKDLDFVVYDYWVWRHLRENLPKWFAEFHIEIRQKQRVILFTKIIAIEFWLDLNQPLNTKQITENIKYIDYGNSI